MLYLLQPEERHCAASNTCWMGSTDTCRPEELRHRIERLSNAGPDDHCHVIIRCDRVPAGEHPGISDILCQ
eukprot:499647-Hanusia_phi.AAC.1